ncbi:hypothetical protein [Flavimarina sp. Hel_I_48]|uniref:hypothetical protein n=1 Tax=Flavimarina sp. Hel_I_48 TaxID=1392488 RepID=UPI0004DF40D2|nr:hypothetical protein [Flavimarina sp. Hel_I_48]
MYYFLTSKRLLSRGYLGIALWPFIIIKYEALKQDAVFVNHERIHLRQQAELLILPFYIWYGIEYVIRWIQYKNTYLAYKNISFEREAYHHEKSLSYLKTRKMWSFGLYL